MADSEEFSNLFNHLMDPNHSSSFTFSDPSFYSNPNAYSPHPSPSTQKNAEASELPSKAVPPPRSSSKRSRAAEFHNLSEKRRRSKINEKMKALQNLIPNSNKTDKASMLDEAIEYLKQLQLQVQMLMMRNGLSLHPMSSSVGPPRSIMLAETGLNLDDANGFQNSIREISSYASDENLARPSYGFPEQCSISNQSIIIPSVTNISTLDASSSFQPSIKDAFCGNMPQLFLGAKRIGKLPSPDVS